jgi:hypothetical protein
MVDFKICGNLDKWKDEKRANHLAKFLMTIKKAA